MRKILMFILIGSLFVDCSELNIERRDATISSVQPSAAVPGSTVVISGSNFTEDAIITIGNLEAEVVSLEEKRIELIIPVSIPMGSTELIVDALGAPASFDFDILPFFVERTPHPDGAIRGTGFVLNNEIYFGLGEQGNGFSAPFYRYNVNSDTWTILNANNSIPDKSGAIGFAVNGKGYVLGTGSDNELWEYDPTTNDWTRKSDYPKNQLLIPVVIVIGSDVYLCTGFHDGISREIWKYSTVTNQWSQMNDFGGVKRGNGVGFVVNGTGYVGQGYDFDTNSRLNDFYAYNAASDTWTEIAAPIQPSANMEGGVGFAIGEKGYIGLGRNGNSAIRDFWKYDTSNDTWHLLTSYTGDGSLGVQVFVVGNKAYLINGTNSNNSEQFVELWEFTPETF